MIQAAAKTYSSIDDFITALHNDPAVQVITREGFVGIPSVTLRQQLTQALESQPEDRVMEIAVSNTEPLVIGGIPIAGLDQQCVLTGTFCRGGDLYAVYSINGKPFSTLACFPDTHTCLSTL